MSIFDGIKLFLFSSIKPPPSECSLSLRRQPHFWHPREMSGHEGGAPHFPPPVFNIWLSTSVSLAISIPPSWIRSSPLCSTHCLKNRVPSVISSLFCHIPLIISAYFPPVIQIYPILLEKTSNLFPPLHYSSISSLLRNQPHFWKNCLHSLSPYFSLIPQPMEIWLRNYRAKGPVTSSRCSLQLSSPAPQQPSVELTPVLSSLVIPPLLGNFLPFWAV